MFSSSSMGFLPIKFGGVPPPPSPPPSPRVPEAGCIAFWPFAGLDDFDVTLLRTHGSCVIWKLDSAIHNDKRLTRCLRTTYFLAWMTRFGCCTVRLLPSDAPPSCCSGYVILGGRPAAARAADGAAPQEPPQRRHSDRHSIGPLPVPHRRLHEQAFDSQQAGLRAPPQLRAARRVGGCGSQGHSGAHAGPHACGALPPPPVRSKMPLCAGSARRELV